MTHITAIIEVLRPAVSVVFDRVVMESEFVIKRPVGWSLCVDYQTDNINFMCCGKNMVLCTRNEIEAGAYKTLMVTRLRSWLSEHLRTGSFPRGWYAVYEKALALAQAEREWRV